MVQAALDKHHPDDVELWREICKIDWSQLLLFGDVKIRIKEGKPTFATVTWTIKID